MITFTNDENLNLISAELGDMETNNNYKVFGLVNNTLGNKKINRCVEIHYSLLVFPDLYNDWEKVSLFLTNNGISSRYMCDKNLLGLFDGIRLIKIGLRKDIRQHHSLCACILKTVILALEKKIKIRRMEQNMRILNLPVFA